MHKYNFVLFTQTGKINLPEGNNHKDTYALALLSEIQQLGFYFEKELFEKVKKLNKTQILEFKNWLIPTLQEAVGSHVRYVPLFKNFPEDVPEENEYLYLRINNFIENCFNLNDQEGVLLACGCYIREEYFALDCFGACPVCQRQVPELMNKAKKKPLKEKTKLRPIGFLSELEAYKTLRNIFNSSVSYSSQVKAQLPEVINLLQEEIFELLPSEIKNKENLALIWSAIKKQTKLPVKQESFQTATDVLRLAVGFSSGDVSLKAKSNYKLTSSERKIILSLVNSLISPLEDMLRFRASWLRLGEYLHVGAYKRKYPQAFIYFEALRNRESSIRCTTFNSQAHKALLELKSNPKSFNLMNILAQRPGEFARKLDFMVRESAHPQEVIKVFSAIVGNLNNVMLLKLHQYFKLRTEAFKFRYFIPKGNMAKIYYKEGDDRKVIQQSLVNQITQIIQDELLKRYQIKKSIKSIYIDPSLKSMLVPLVQRNSNKNLETLYRGSRVQYNAKAQALRLFLYWKENEKSGRIDVDLSASGYDENWQYITNLSWTSLASMDCQHSGDIQSAPEGASEFIDINVNSMKQNKVRYVVVNVFSWTGQKFQDFECFAGVMERSKTSSGEVYEPKTVKNKFDLAGDTSVNAPMILDLATNEIIWADIAFNSSVGRRVENSTKQIAMMGKSLLAMGQQEPNLFDLFSFYAKSQGAIIYTSMPKVTPDLVITEAEAKDVANILSNWI